VTNVVLAGDLVPVSTVLLTPSLELSKCVNLQSNELWEIVVFLKDHVLCTTVDYHDMTQLTVSKGLLTATDNNRT